MEYRWNFNMDEAPRGRTETVDRTIKGKIITIERHVPEMIIAAGNGGIVTVSRWLPEAGRWNMFTKDCPPLAWMPWPQPPT